MTDVKNKPPVKSRTPVARRLPDDPWRDWQPQWRGAGTPHDLQERHAPTEAVYLRDAHGRDQEHCQRRILDARLWDGLPAASQAAARQIMLHYESLSRGLGFATSDPQRLPGARNPLGAINGFAQLRGLYDDWVAACRKDNLSHSMVIDVLCFDISCKLLDRDRGVRSGTSRQNLLAALALYARLAGWTRTR